MTVSVYFPIQMNIMLLMRPYTLQKANFKTCCYILHLFWDIERYALNQPFKRFGVCIIQATWIQIYLLKLLSKLTSVQYKYSYLRSELKFSFSVNIREMVKSSTFVGHSKYKIIIGLAPNHVVIFIYQHICIRGYLWF